MSGLEAIAVIGVVASLITAFKDSSAIANAIKQRRKAKPGALPPTFELEEALTAGEQEIHKAATEGSRRWGSNWVDDDIEAKVALQEIVIEVQASMLKDLRIAVQDDSVTDFTNVIEVSTEARMRAVNILTGLYLQKKSSLAKGTPSRPTRISTGAHEQGIPFVEQFSQTAVPTENLQYTLTPQRKAHPANEWIGETNGSQPRNRPGDEQKHEQSRPSWKRKISGWTQSYVDQLPKEPRLAKRDQPPSDRMPRPLPSLSTEATHPDRPNPWAETRSITDSDSRRSIHSVQSHQLDRRDTRFSAQNTMISPDNSFGGFCPGAYQLQVGLIDSAIKIHNQSVSMTGQGQYYACRGKRCVFEGPAVMYERGWSYDRNLRSRPGLKYRWLFLAKSHIPQERVRNKLYDFRCLICVLLGDESAIYHGASQLLEHVTGHAGTQLPGIVLRGPILFGNNSITEAQDDNFDVDFASVSDRTSSILENVSLSPTSTSISSDRLSTENYDTLSTFNPKWR